MIIARVLAVVLVAAVVGCAPGDEGGSPPSSSRSSVTSQTTTSSSVAADFCSDWYAFNASGGASYTLAVIELYLDGETPEERLTVSTYVDGMVQFGTSLVDEVPADIEEQLRSIVLAAAEAQNSLASGVPTIDAIAALESDAVTAAREAVVAYKETPC